MKTYSIDVFGESQYNFDIELSDEELAGAMKVLSRCNELAEYNDSFTVIDKETNEELLTWM